MRKYRWSMFIAIIVLLLALSGCTPALKTSIDLTNESETNQKADFEADDSAMPSSGTTASFVSPEELGDPVWSHENGLVIKRGRLYTKDAYKGDFRAELEVEIIYTQPEAIDFEGFLLGMGFREKLDASDPIFNVFKALQLYGSHTGPTQSVGAFSILPHMAYESLASFLDTEAENVMPFELGLLPGLEIGNGSDVSGFNLIVIERTGGTIKVSVNGTNVGEYESKYETSYDLPFFHDFDVERPVRIGVFSACVHIEKTEDTIEEGVFLKSLKVYADEIIEHSSI